MSDRQIRGAMPPRQCRHCTQQATTLVHPDPVSNQYGKVWVCDTQAAGRREVWRG